MKTLGDFFDNPNFSEHYAKQYDNIVIAEGRSVFHFFDAETGENIIADLSLNQIRELCDAFVEYLEGPQGAPPRE